MRSLDLNAKHWAITAPGDRVSHHARHAISRRAFLGSIGTAGAVAGVGLLSLPVLAAKPSNAAPRPTANTFTVGEKTFHLTLFGPWD